MTFKANIATDSRVFYVLVNGNDGEAGTSLETAKGSIQGAIDAVNALIPPPNAIQRAAIILEGSGVFSENITFPNFTSVEAAGSTNAVATGTNYTLGSFAKYEFGLVASSATGATMIDVANRNGVSISVGEGNVTGDNTTFLSISGTTDDSFFRTSQLRLQGDGDIGVNYTAQNGEPEVFLFASITLEENNVTAFRYAPTVSTARAIFDVGGITEIGSPTNTTAITVTDGHLSCFVNEIVASDAIDIQGGELSIISNCVSGDITIASGSTLVCEIIEYSGTITNNGTIQGRLGDQYFGDPFVEGPATSVVNAIATFDTTTGDSIQSVDFATVATTGASTILDVQPVNNTGTAALTVSDSGGVLKGEFEYIESSDTLQILSTVATMQFGAGPGASLIEFIGNDTEFLFQTGGTNNSFSIDMTDSPDSNPPLIMTTGGTNGATIEFYTGSRDPEGNVSANPGSIYYRRSGINSRTYQLEAATAGNTGWVANQGSVDGPVSSVVNSIPTWSDTLGTSLNSVGNALLTDDGSIINLSLESPSLTGNSRYTLLDSTSTEVARLNFEESSGTVALGAFGTHELELFSSTTMEFLGDSVPDTTAAFTWQTTGTNGQLIRYFVGSRNPEGLVSASPGSIYYRIDGLNSTAYQLKAAATGTTGWADIGFGITGPATSTDNGLATWNGTTSSALNSLSLITATESASLSTINIQSAGATGSASVEFLDSSSVAQGSWGYTESTDDIVFVSSAGAGMDFIIGVGNVDFQFNQTVGTFDLVGPSHTDANSLFSITTSSTNGATIRYYCGDRNPEGNITADPGSIYYRVDGVNSRTYQLEAAATGNTGWVANQGNVDGPATSTTNSLAFFIDTTGQEIDSATTITYPGLANTSILQFNSPSASSTLGINMITSLSGFAASFLFNESTDRTELNDGSGNGLFFSSDQGNYEFFADSGAGNCEIDIISPNVTGSSAFALKDSSEAVQWVHFYSESTDTVSTIISAPTVTYEHPQETTILTSSTAGNFLRIRNPDSTSIAGWIIDDSGINVAMQLLYSETLDQNQLFDESGNGMLFRTENGFSVLGNAMPDTDVLFNWETDGTNGSIIEWHIGTRDPNTNINASPGAIYLRGSGSDSNIFIHKDTVTSTANWIAVGDVSSDFVLGTNEAIAYFSGTTGKIITEDDSVTIDPASTQAGLRFTTPTGGSGAALSFRNIAAAVRSNIFFSQSLDSFTVQHIGTGDFNLITNSVFDFQGNTIPDTSPVFTWRNTGTDGGSVDVHIGDRTPEGNVTAQPGAFYFREDGTSSDIYVHRDSISSNTGWVEIIEGTVKTNLSSSTNNAVTVWGGVTGTTIQEVPEVVINETGGDTTINARVGSANGSSSLELADSVGFGVGNLRYDDNANTVTLQALASTSLSFFAEAAPITIEHDEAGGANAILALITSTADSSVYVHNSTPVGAHTGNPGDLFIEENGAQSDIYIHSGTVANNTDWSGLRTDKSIAAMNVVNNATATVIAAINTWTDLNLNASAAASISNTNWTVSNTTTGELTYNGTNDITVISMFNASLLGLAGQDTYQIRTLVNGSVTADNIIASTTFNNQQRNITLIAPITVSTNDTVRIQIQNTTAADNVTVVQVSHVIR